MRISRPSIASRYTVRAAAACLIAAAIPLTASALDYPARKAGLWQITTNGTTGTTKNPEQVTLQCVDKASDQALQKMGAGMMAGMKCEKNDSAREGNKYVGHSICQMGPSKLESQSVMSGDFEQEYTMTAESTFSPPMAGISGSKTTMAAKWIGPCKADQKPGDVIVNGQKMNLLNMGGKP